jgi:hypothetical protein
MNFTEANNERGVTFTLATANGARRSGLHLTDHPVLAGLIPHNRAFGEQIAHVVSTYQQSRWAAEIAKIAGPILTAVHTAIEAGRQNRRDLAASKARARAVPPSVDMTHAAELRSRYRGVEIGAQIERVNAADLRELAALVADGNLAELADAAWQLAEQRYLALAHVERAGTVADFERKPTLDMLTAIGPDIDAAEAAAVALVEQMQQREADLDTVEQALQNQIVILALALETTPQQVLEQVLTA